MQRSRRALLKTVGTAGAASALPVGTALAQEDKEKQCVETVGENVTDQAYIYAGLVAVDEALPEQAQTPFAYAGPARGETGFGNQRTETFQIPEGAFEEAELPGRRMKITASWNPVDAGPSNFEVFVQRQNIAGEYDNIGFKVGSFYEVGQNEFTLTLVDGEEHFGPTPTQPVNSTETQTERSEIVVGGGETYRYFVAARRGIVNFSITNEFQAFDPECGDDEE
jgi:hypothetical protein